MRIRSGHKVIVSPHLFAGTLAVCALGWLIAFYVIGQITPSDAVKTISLLGLEVAKIVFVGSSIGIAFNWYMKQVLGKTPWAALRKSGIAKVYSDRQSAEEDYVQQVKSPKTKSVDIMGISLREFLAPGGSLHPVWQAICQRLESEQKSNIEENKRLHVRILLLDPRSLEGLFRHHVEKHTIGRQGLPFDIPYALEAVKHIQEDILSEDKERKLLQVRLYEHCPFFFMFHTDSCAFVEQYNYRDHSRPDRLPLLKYDQDSSQFHQLINSFEMIWENAKKTPISPYYIGTGEALGIARVRNIFRRDQRRLLGERQNEVVRSIEQNENAFVHILAISGKFYTSHPMLETLTLKASKSSEGNAIKVKIALVNPVSQQAIMRAIADSCSPAQREQAFSNWSWERHITTDLYMDVHRSRRELRERIKERECNFEIHLYSCSIACCLLLTPTVGFVEQYVYGRSNAALKARVLGGEVPCVEYELGKRFLEVDNIYMDNTEEEIFHPTFDVVWDLYSIDDSSYIDTAEKEHFNANLERIRAELPHECKSANNGQCASPLNTIYSMERGE